MPKITIDLLCPGDESAKKIFEQSFQDEIDWVPFQLDSENSAKVRGTFDASNRGFALVLLVGNEQVFDAGGYIAERKPIQFGVKVNSLYVGIFFEPDDVIYK